MMTGVQYYYKGSQELFIVLTCQGMESHISVEFSEG
jgi:hypothetical protein